MPLTYFQPTRAVAQSTQPFFNPNIFHITAIPYLESLYDTPYETHVWVDGTIFYTELPDGGSVGVVMCYDITPEGADLGYVDAKIEVFNFHFYSEHGSILNITQSVAIAGNVPDKSSPNGITDAIIGWDSNQNTYTFADGTVYDFSEVLGNVEESSVSYVTSEWSAAAKVIITWAAEPLYMNLKVKKLHRH